MTQADCREWIEIPTDDAHDIVKEDEISSPYVTDVYYGMCFSSGPDGRDNASWPAWESTDPGVREYARISPAAYTSGFPMPGPLRADDDNDNVGGRDHLYRYVGGKLEDK